MFGGGKKMNMFISPLIVIVLLANLAVYGLHITRKAMALKGKVIKDDQLARFNVTTFYSAHLILIVANIIFTFLVFKSNAKLAYSLLTLVMFDMGILIYFSVLASKASGSEVLVPGAAQFSVEYQKHTKALLAVYSTAAAVTLLSFGLIF